MSVVAFDTLAAVKQLRDAGVEERQAEAVVAIVSKAVGEQVTKADLEPLATKSNLLALKADLYRALWMQAAAIIGIVFALMRLLS